MLRARAFTLALLLSSHAALAQAPAPAPATPAPAPATATPTPAPAPAPATPAPAPPSTGRELPKAPARALLTPEQQRAALDRGLALFRAPRRDCAAVRAALIPGLWGGAQPTPVDKDSTDPYAALALCSAETNHWITALRIVNELLRVDPATPHAWLQPRAEIALGLYGDAREHLVALGKQRPTDAQLAVTNAIGACRVEAWAICDEAALGAAKLVDALPEGRPRAEATAELHVLRGEALFHTGRFDESTQEIEAALALAGPRPDVTLEKRLKRNEIVKQSRLAVEPVYDQTIPLGVYHLLGRVKGTKPLVALKLYNFADTSRSVRIEVEIPGVTDKAVNTKLLLKGRREVEEIVPPLRTDFPIASVRAERPAMLSIKITSGVETLYEKSYPVTLLPRDTLPLAQRVDADLSVPTPGFIAAWVTPNAKPVDAFLAAAKARAGGTFAGTQRPTFPQVKAIWDELQAQGVSYVMDPAVLADFGYAQRTRLPAEVLAVKNAQCLEGTILFATLLEAIGLEPILVRVPGHAFVGWRPTEKDGAKPGDLAFVETTMVHDAPFEAAVKVALARVVEERKRGSFAKGIYGPAFMLDLSDLRKAGFRPQPLD